MAFVLSAIVWILEQLIANSKVDAVFFSECEKVLKAVFNLIVKSNHPNTVLTKIAVDGLAVLNQVDASVNTVAPPSDPNSPIV
jgi:hypothetical protein